MCNCCISPGVVAARRSKVGQPHSHLPHMYRVQARSAHQLCMKQLCLTSLLSPAKSIPIDAEPGFGTFPAIVSVALVMRSAERRCDVGQPHSRLSHMYRVQALSAYKLCLKQLRLTSLLSPAKAIPIDPEPGSRTMPAIVSVAPAMQQCCRCTTAAPHRHRKLRPALCRVSNSLQTCAVAPPLTPV